MKSTTRKLRVVLVVMAAALVAGGWAQSVNPGVPSRVEFRDPISLTKLGNGIPAEINRGVDYPVLVEVQDEYGNAVDVPTRVDIVSDNPNIGDVGAPGAIGTKNVTTGTDGVAKFTAKATNGRTGDTFIMTATITVNGAKKEDQGKLRLGRALDRLEVFYSDTTRAGYDPDAKIKGIVGDWFKITVKVLTGDTVNTAETSPKVVRVVSDNSNLVFSAAANGAAATEFPLVRGVATFWVTGTGIVSGACVDVEALVGAGGEVFGGIAPGNRCDITFIQPSNVTLRYRASPGGYIAIGDTVQIVEYGSRGAMVVAMPDEGYEFTMWSDGASNFVRTDSNVTSNKTVTANFCAAANIKPLTYKAGAGGVVSGPAEQKVCGNTSGLPVTAVPNEGYKFVEWSDGKKDAARTDAGGASGVDVTASFVIKTYTLAYTAGPNGSLIGGDAVMTVAHGSDGGIVLALADDGYEFVKWSDGVTDNPRTDRNVSANVAASAVFDTLRHNLSYHVNPEMGVLAGSASQRVAHGASGSSVYVTGVNGYTFFEWSDGSKDSIRTDKTVLADISVSAVFKDAAGNVVSVVSRDRVIPSVRTGDGVTAIAPVSALTAEFAVGPNPAGKSSGAVTFFRQGGRISSAKIAVYDASGNAVRKISVKDGVNNNAVIGNNSRRAVGSWDLRDAKGRVVSEGSYLVRGTIKTFNGKSERVSAVVGVR